MNLYCISVLKLWLDRLKVYGNTNFRDLNLLKRKLIRVNRHFFEIKQVVNTWIQKNLQIRASILRNSGLFTWKTLYFLRVHYLLQFLLLQPRVQFVFSETYVELPEQGQCTPCVNCAYANDVLYNNINAVLPYVLVGMSTHTRHASF